MVAAAASSSSSSASAAIIMLDPDIRDWVVLPLFVIMIAAGLLRHHVGVLLASDKVPVNVLARRCQGVMQQASRVKSMAPASHYLTTTRWQQRQAHMVAHLRATADWVEEQEQPETSDADDPMSAMMNNPLSMLKGNMAFMVQNMVMMQGIQHFFSGFILLQVPFPLTTGFKQMFQRGIEPLPDLAPSYVSSVSWYFLVMYGLRSFFKLAIGDPTLEQREQERLSAQLGYQLPPPPGKAAPAPTELAKQLRTEAENLELMAQGHVSQLDSVERRLLGSRYPKKRLQTNASDFLLVGGGSSINKVAAKKKQ